MAEMDSGGAIKDKTVHPKLSLFHPRVLKKRDSSKESHNSFENSSNFSDEVEIEIRPKKFSSRD